MQMSPFIWLLSVLASFRLALMFSKEKGPGFIFKAIREATDPMGKLRAGLECVLCESVWWAGLITIYLACIKQVSWDLSPIYWLATSTGACIIHFQWNQDEP